MIPPTPHAGQIIEERLRGSSFTGPTSASVNSFATRTPQFISNQPHRDSRSRLRLRNQTPPGVFRMAESVSAVRIRQRHGARTTPGNAATLAICFNAGEYPRPAPPLTHNTRAIPPERAHREHLSLTYTSPRTRMLGTNPSATMSLVGDASVIDAASSSYERARRRPS